MKTYSANDAAINEQTIKKMLEPVIEFIKEHDSVDRESLFSTVIHETGRMIGVSTSRIVGVLESEKTFMLLDTHEQAKLYAKAGINPKRTIEK